MSTADINAASRKHDYVRQASQDQLPPCPKCGAAKGDACRTPGWKTTKPHVGRRYSATMTQLYLLGREIWNQQPETDVYDPAEDQRGLQYDSGNTFEDGTPTHERVTPPGSRGVIVAVRPEESGTVADVVFFETGAWIILAQDEVFSDKYRLGEIIPQAMWPE